MTMPMMIRFHSVSARRNFGAPVDTASLPKVNLQIYGTACSRNACDYSVAINDAGIQEASCRQPLLNRFNASSMPVTLQELRQRRKRKIHPGTAAPEPPEARFWLAVL